MIVKKTAQMFISSLLTFLDGAELIDLGPSISHPGMSLFIRQIMYIPSCKISINNDNVMKICHHQHL